uniref:proteasome endopeptidase complex n=1 Tax=Parastrongyloides trichosuri TaxID=131310 RepID=A0A0N4ZKN2_PARTI
MLQARLRDSRKEHDEENDVRLIQEPSLHLNEHNFVMPPNGICPKDFVKAHFGEAAKHNQFRKGTTCLSFCYEPATPNDKGGIIIAVDARASAGAYISSKNVMKILDVSPRMVATMAGGAADCQYWTRVVAKYCTLYELKEKTPITVAAASKYFANLMYSYKNYGLSVGSMVAGYDKRGPGLYMIDNEGRRLSLKMCSVGSGSLNAYGVLDTCYKPKMTDEEARKLGRRAIMHATYRDSGSGGVVNMVHITPDEKIKFPKIDVSDLFYEFADEIGRDIVYDPKNDE